MGPPRIGKTTFGLALLRATSAEAPGRIEVRTFVDAPRPHTDLLDKARRVPGADQRGQTLLDVLGALPATMVVFFDELGRLAPREDGETELQEWDASRRLAVEGLRALVEAPTGPRLVLAAMMEANHWLPGLHEHVQAFRIDDLSEEVTHRIARRGAAQWHEHHGELVGHVFAYTRGHPQLTQQLLARIIGNERADTDGVALDARAIAREPGSLVMQRTEHSLEQFIRARRVSLLLAYLDLLEGRGSAAAADEEVKGDLWTTGLVRVGPDGVLEPRNSMMLERFGAGWARQQLFALDRPRLAELRAWRQKGRLPADPEAVADDLRALRSRSVEEERFLSALDVERTRREALQAEAASARIREQEDWAIRFRDQALVNERAVAHVQRQAVSLQLATGALAVLLAAVAVPLGVGFLRQSEGLSVQQQGLTEQQQSLRVTQEALVGMQHSIEGFEDKVPNLLRSVDQLEEAVKELKVLETKVVTFDQRLLQIQGSLTQSEAKSEALRRDLASRVAEVAALEALLNDLKDTVVPAIQARISAVEPRLAEAAETARRAEVALVDATLLTAKIECTREENQAETECLDCVAGGGTWDYPGDDCKK